MLGEPADTGIPETISTAPKKQRIWKAIMRTKPTCHG